MSNLKSLASSSVVYGIGSALTKSMSLFALPIFTKYLTPQEYGVLALILLLSTLIQPILTLGINSSMGISYFKKNSIENHAQTVWSSFLLLFFSSLVLLFVSNVFLDEISKVLFNTSKYDFLIQVAIISTVLNVIATPFMLRLQFENKAKLFVILTFISTLINIITSIYLVKFMEIGILGMVYGQLISSVFLFIGFFWFAKNQLPLAVEFDKVRTIFFLGYPLIPSSFFLLILIQSNRYILEIFDGLEIVGIYSIGFSFGMLMNIFVSGFTQAWYVFFMKYTDKQNEIKNRFANILYLYIVIFGTILVIFFLLAKPIIDVFVDEKFVDAYIVVGLVAMSQFFLGIFSIFTPLLYYNEEVKYVSVFQGVAALISIPINIVCIYYFHLLGAGIGLSLSILLMIVLQVLWNRFRYKCSIEYNIYESFKISILIFIIILICSFIDNIYLLAISFFMYLTVMILMIIKNKNKLNLMELIN